MKSSAAGGGRVNDQDGIVIGVDMGTTSTKSVAYDVSGRVAASHAVGYPLQEPKPGYAEQDPDAILAAVAQTVASVVLQCDGRIRALSFSSAMHTLIGLDREHEPLTHVITWADQRASGQAERLRAGPGGWPCIGAPARRYIPWRRFRNSSGSGRRNRNWLPECGIGSASRTMCCGNCWVCWSRTIRWPRAPVSWTFTGCNGIRRAWTLPESRQISCRNWSGQRRWYPTYPPRRRMPSSCPARRPWSSVRAMVRWPISAWVRFVQVWQPARSGPAGRCG